MAQDTGHINLAVDQVKDIRTDTRLDDGAAFVIRDGQRYEVFNTGKSEVSLAERATSRGIPDLETDDAILIPPKRSAWITVAPGFEYYTWSLNAPSRVALSEL